VYENNTEHFDDENYIPCYLILNESLTSHPATIRALPLIM